MNHLTDVAEPLQAAHTGTCPSWCAGHYEDIHRSGLQDGGPFRAELSAPADHPTVISLVGDVDRSLTLDEAEDLAATLLELTAAARVAA